MSRPESSALIFERSRKSGRSVLKARMHDEREERQHAERDQGQLGVEVEEDAERQHRGDHAADGVDQAGAHQVADPLGVVHHAREQGARLGAVEVADRQPADVLLHRRAASR